MSARRLHFSAGSYQRYTENEVGSDFFGGAVAGNDAEPVLANRDGYSAEIYDVGSVTPYAVCANLVNSLIGAGILAVPNAFTATGLIPGLGILLVTAVISCLGSIIILILQLRTGVKGYDDLVHKLFGRVGSVVFSILTLVFLEGLLLAYLVLGGDMIITWLGMASVQLNRILVMAVYTLVLPVPLTVPKSGKLLEMMSWVTVLLILFYIAGAGIRAGEYWVDEGVGPTVTLVHNVSMDWFTALSIFCLAFALPSVILPIIGPYEENTKKRIGVTIVAMAICFMLVMTPSLMCYLVFGDECQSDIMKNFDPMDLLMLTVRCGFFIIVTFSYPVIARSAMASWSQLFFRNNDSMSMTGWKRIVLIFSVNAVPVIVSWFLPEAKTALAIGGALGGCFVSFVFPATLWIRNSELPFWHCKNIPYSLFALFGISAATAATFQAIVDAVAVFATV